ncbi:hypothetical protein [uncultured Endozoicomonas sp.]|uniref:hypothetical protein n=1 Tax=uncultured Endozoicomonas sp. TaxID=432652 RepID=UPI002608890C|nr:hypothetical protein [uncultured Endozoicomonas sp.]
MRWIVLLLVFLNVGYFAWGFYKESRADYRLLETGFNYEDSAGGRLVLLSEMMEQEKPGQEAPSHLDISGGSDGECLFVGPFDSPLEVDAIKQQLFSMGVDSRERADATSEIQDYWVHIPPLPSRVAAARMLRELHAQKIDSFVITYGELDNGISLGLFSKKEYAESVRRRLSDTGYTVKIKELSHSPEQWWLEMDSAVDEKLGADFWEQMSSRYPDAKKRKKNCKSIATEE